MSTKLEFDYDFEYDYDLLPWRQWPVMGGGLLGHTSPFLHVFFSGLFPKELVKQSNGLYPLPKSIYATN